MPNTHQASWHTLRILLINKTKWFLLSLSLHVSNRGKKYTNNFTTEYAMCYEVLGCKVRSPSNKNSQEKSLRGCGIWPKTQSKRTVRWGAGTRTTEPKRATTTTTVKRRQSEALREAGTGPCAKSREPEKGLFEERLEKWAGSCQPCGGVSFILHARRNHL